MTSSAKSPQTPFQRAVIQKQGAVIGGWVCVSLGVAFMTWSLWSFLFYLPLFLAAFVLAIVAIAQRRLFNGIPMLLCSVGLPLIFGLVLGAFRTHELITSGGRTGSIAGDVASARASAEASLQNARKAQAEANGLAPEGTVTTPASSDAQEALAYIANDLQLYEFKAKTFSTYDGRVPGVEFKLRNKGARTLDEIEVKVMFKDASGTVIAEESYHPVLVTHLNIMGNNNPLKPGYIWQQENGRFFRAKSVPSEWQEGAAEAVVSSIRFHSGGR